MIVPTACAVLGFRVEKAAAYTLIYGGVKEKKSAWDAPDSGAAAVAPRSGSSNFLSLLGKAMAATE